MSLYELMTCSRKDGGCGHARHRHTRAGGNAARTFSGACRTVGSDGPCPCVKFKERKEEKIHGRVD